MLRKLVQVIKARRLSPNSDEYHNYIKKKYDRFDLMRTNLLRRIQQGLGFLEFLFEVARTQSILAFLAKHVTFR